jgi:hypothetical protein
VASDAERVNTVIHEVTHLPTVLTDDTEGIDSYGQDNARKLAANNPAKAVNNAENYCLFATSGGFPATC